MNRHRNTHRLFPLLALSMTLAMAASAQAEDRPDTRSSSISATLQVRFGTPLHWTSIQGTRVEGIPASERSGYDVFRYGGSYYAYDNNRWYMSARESGDFAVIDDRSVPSEFSSIPREHWRNYPSRWQERHDRGSSGSYASLQINFGRTPRWSTVRGTRVRMIRQGQRPDYDMFSYGGRYYVYNHDRWYMSSRWSGQFLMIEERSVPREFYNIPRHQWRSYPVSWLDGNGNPRRGDRGRDRFSSGNDPWGRTDRR